MNPLPALLAATIWAVSPICYKDYLVRNSPIKINFLRLFYASSFLVLPFLYFGFNQAIVYGALSGLLSLAIGDTFYLLSIEAAGASVAAPVSYTYVFLIQFVATFFGEPLRFNYVVSSLLIVVGIYLLSDKKNLKRMKGVLLALLSALFWTIGQAVIKIATTAELNPMSIAFARVSSAMVVIGAYMLIKRSDCNLAISGKQHLLLAGISILDLGLGSTLYVYSIGVAGLTTTIILTSISPLVTQVVSKAMGKEAPSRRDITASLVIVMALIVAAV
ncbi:MAG: DMT family transporter [Thermoproteota archaeon]